MALPAKSQGVPSLLVKSEGSLCVFVGDGEFAACRKEWDIASHLPTLHTFQLQHPLLPPATPPASQGFL